MMEAVDFKGGPADGRTERVEAEGLEPGGEIGILGGTYRILGKARGAAWQAVYITPEEPEGPA